jgi:hypothetical protein
MTAAVSLALLGWHHRGRVPLDDGRRFPGLAQVVEGIELGIEHHRGRGRRWPELPGLAQVSQLVAVWLTS